MTTSNSSSKRSRSSCSPLPSKRPRTLSDLTIWGECSFPSSSFAFSPVCGTLEDLDDAEAEFIDNDNDNDHEIDTARHPSTDDNIVLNAAADALHKTRGGEGECDVVHQHANAHMDIDCDSSSNSNTNSNDTFVLSLRSTPNPDADPFTLPITFESEIENTLKYIHFFFSTASGSTSTSTTKDNHKLTNTSTSTSSTSTSSIPLSIPQLTGSENYPEWALKMEFLLKLHRVWCTVDGSVESLYPGHEYYVWYQHMEAVAMSCILAHVSQQVYADMAHFECARSPVRVWYALWMRYGSSTS